MRSGNETTTLCEANRNVHQVVISLVEPLIQKQLRFVVTTNQFICTSYTNLVGTSVPSSSSTSATVCLVVTRQTLFPSSKKGSSAGRHLVTALYSHGAVGLSSAFCAMFDNACCLHRSETLPSGQLFITFTQFSNYIVSRACSTISRHWQFIYVNKWKKKKKLSREDRNLNSEFTCDTSERCLLQTASARRQISTLWFPRSAKQVHMVVEFFFFFLFFHQNGHNVHRDLVPTQIKKNKYANTQHTSIRDQIHNIVHQKYFTSQQQTTAICSVITSFGDLYHSRFLA